MKPDSESVLGYIASPCGNGAATVNRERMRGRKPRWYNTREKAIRACHGIEREGHRDGGRGRDCYIVMIQREANGRITVGTKTGAAGMFLGGSTTVTIGSDNNVTDALAWLRARPRRWLLAHGLT